MPLLYRNRPGRALPLTRGLPGLPRACGPRNDGVGPTHPTPPLTPNRHCEPHNGAAIQGAVLFIRTHGLPQAYGPRNDGVEPTHRTLPLTPNRHCEPHSGAAIQGTTLLTRTPGLPRAYGPRNDGVKPTHRALPPHSQPSLRAAKRRGNPRDDSAHPNTWIATGLRPSQ